MKSRGLRVALAALFVLVLAGAAYEVWNEEAQVQATTAASRSFEERLRLVSRSLFEIKSAQPGYVAAGQGDEYWSTKVDGLLASTREGLAALRSAARAPVAQAEIDAAAASLEDFEQMDRRAREYTHGGQRLLASDLVFSDGIEKIDGAVASLERARSLEAGVRDEEVQQGRWAQVMTLGGAAAAGFLLLALLTPLPYEPIARKEPEPKASAPQVQATRPSAAAGAGARKPRPSAMAGAASTVAAANAAPAPPAAAPRAAAQPPPAAPASPAVDLGAVAALCTDLARVLDTRALPGALERAAKVLDAAGIVIWVADPDGRELAPVAAHGYPENLVARMGTIARDAENVTAAAFRTGLVQTVKGDNASPGAIAAPLLTAAGPVGVMAAEVLHDGERREAVRAVAGILAAQLATLMGPPMPRQGKAEVAG
jgi:hypothetical protein